MPTRPYRCSERELAKIGVELIDLHGRWLRCTKCDPGRSPDLLSGGRMPRGYWRCPHGDEGLLLPSPAGAFATQVAQASARNSPAVGLWTGGAAAGAQATTASGQPGDGLAHRRADPGTGKEENPT